MSITCISALCVRLGWLYRLCFSPNTLIGDTERDIKDDKVPFRWGNPVYLHQARFSPPLMYWSNIVPVPILILQPQQSLACSRSALSTGEVAYKASSKTQNTTCQTGRCFDPRWPPESQRGSTASGSQGWIHRHGVSAACQGYLHHLSLCKATISRIFFSSCCCCYT